MQSSTGSGEEDFQKRLSIVDQLRNDPKLQEAVVAFGRDPTQRPEDVLRQYDVQLPPGVVVLSSWPPQSDRTKYACFIWICFELPD